MRRISLDNAASEEMDAHLRQSREFERLMAAPRLTTGEKKALVVTSNGNLVTRRAL